MPAADAISSMETSSGERRLNSSRATPINCCRRSSTPILRRTPVVMRTPYRSIPAANGPDRAPVFRGRSAEPLDRLPALQGALQVGAGALFGLHRQQVALRGTADPARRLQRGDVTAAGGQQIPGARLRLP